ncbi:hypothetical protein G7Z17_g3020 [Cylindrodendrum hubeiense]|uniref:beta-glucosidase n=1 Tax=Cylindrodendrum hubeiense TaxID=595255 RepID=A0A9P5LDX5_9HYPO|nr:hypothetical protein G7Z17_g3020 [Cylindrodendrum hubeiense]
MGDASGMFSSRQDTLQDLTTSEKISLLSGTDFWHTANVPRLNIPKLRMSDGPNGVRGTRFFNSVPAACLPCGTALDATWDTRLMQEAGQLIARECYAKSAHVWLGPTVNIQRSPLGGRGFESFSEDPVLSGTMAAAMISAVQKSGIASALKHFVTNDMEHERTLVNCIISQRALREIYLLPFQLAIRDANPWCLMTAYNRVNGTHMSENPEILTDIVRKEWKYDGCILSDWFGTYSTVESINSGLDLEMPGPPEWRAKKVSTALGTAIIGPNAKISFFSGGGSASLRPYRSVSIFEALSAEIEEPLAFAEGCQIHNMLPVLGDLIRNPTGKLGHFMMKMYLSPPWEEAQDPLDTFELDDTNIILYDYSNPAASDNGLYARIETDLVVEHSDKYAFGITVAGAAKLFLDDKLVVDNSETQTRGESFFGSGSVEEIGHIQLEGSRTYRLRVDFGSAATSNMSKTSAPTFGAGGVRIGCMRCNDQSKEFESAVELAKTVDQVVLCVGLGPEWESEGSDRKDFQLPGQQTELISRICAANPNVVVIIQSSTPASGPWDEVPALIQAWYGGNESGHSIADVLLGKTNPSGKLPLSWPRYIEDNPAFLSYRCEAGKCHYSEDIYVGYRFYEKTRREVQWPFGHGLSYESFRLSNLRLSCTGLGLESHLQVAVTVTNTHESVDGSEVCQAYVRFVTESKLSRPVKELKGYVKVFVSADSTTDACISIPTNTKDLLLDPSIRGVDNIKHTVVAAASSSSSARAEAFLKDVGAPSTAKAYGSYEELVQDANVEIIYVATPHSHHYQNVMLCLEAGKHVLCEKAFTVNAQQARLLAEKAKEKDCFLMEALWTRYFPLADYVREVIDSGKLGTIYRYGQTSADETTTMLLTFPRDASSGGDAHAISTTSMRIGSLQNDAGSQASVRIQGELGELQLFPTAHNPNATKLILKDGGVEEKRWSKPGPGKGSGWYNGFLHYTNPEGEGQGMFWEADEAGFAIIEGRKEGKHLGLAETISIMETLDEVRRQGDLVYPDNVETVDYPAKV